MGPPPLKESRVCHCYPVHGAHLSLPCRVAGVSLEQFEVFKALAAEERNENLDGVPLDEDEDDVEYEMELLENKLSYQQYGYDAPPVRGPRWLSTGNRKPIDAKG